MPDVDPEGQAGIDCQEGRPQVEVKRLRWLPISWLIDRARRIDGKVCSYSCGSGEK